MSKCEKAPESAQLSWIPDSKETESRANDVPASVAHFLRGNPDRLFIGDVKLDNYLRKANKGWVLKFRERLYETDATVFISKYKSCGRKPYPPFVILGLILYGAQMGRWSLRELEDLAKLDLGAWWICGGLQPDHSTIGDFINMHSDALQAQFFITLTSHLVKGLGLSSRTVAGDGTVIEAASSRFSMLKAEALEKKVKCLESSGKQSSKAFLKARDALNTARERDVKRKHKNGSMIKTCKVCREEPEAVVQPRKDGVKRPGYKPSILSNRNRFITGQHVEAASEMACVKPMIKQHHDIFGLFPHTSLFDGNYETFEMLEMAIELEIDVLCGAGKRKKVKHFSKSDFNYDQKTDEYVCPEGKRMKYRKSGHSRGGKYREYQCRECEGCNVRIECTKSKTGRSVLRFEREELKETIREIMKHPAAKKLFSYRKAMVEPVFGDLKYRHGLNRFRRKGIRNVRVEFSLHCMAYNLRRAVRFESNGHAFVVFFTVYNTKQSVFELNIAILSCEICFIVKFKMTIRNGR